MDVLPKRFEKYGLTLHPEKTRLVEFLRPTRRRSSHDDDDRGGPGTFDLLGFTYFWGLSRKGKWIVKQRTARDRFSRAVKRIAAWCRRHMHQPVKSQWQILTMKVRGHYGYFGITGNYKALERFRDKIKDVWRRWLRRRSSSRGRISFDTMNRLLERFPLPPPRIVRRNWTPPA